MVLLTLRPTGEDELLERGDGGVGVVLAGPDVGAVEQPELHLDWLLPAGGHLLHGPDRGRLAFHAHQPPLLPPPSKIPTGNRSNQPPGAGEGIRARRNSGVGEERAARNPSREGKHRCGSHGGGSDLLREDLELLRGGQSEEERRASRGGGEKRNRICGRFNRYTLCDLDFILVITEIQRGVLYLVVVCWRVEGLLY